MSELRLETLIDHLEGVSNLQNMDALNPIVTRISHPTNKTVAVIACSQKEPSTLVLPLNVTWIDFDGRSLNYKKALRRVSKTPDPITGRDHTWEIDVFEGDNAGLIVAEIELDDPDECFDKPEWLGEEVTDDARYYNTCLSSHPFKNWALSNDAS